MYSLFFDNRYNTISRASILLNFDKGYDITQFDGPQLHIKSRIQAPDLILKFDKNYDIIEVQGPSGP